MSSVVKPLTNSDSAVVSSAENDDFFSPLEPLSGAKYFERLSQKACKIFNADIAFIGTPHTGGLLMQPLGLMADGKRQPAKKFELAAGLFEQVAASDPFLHLDDAQDKYPGYAILSDHEIRGLLAFRLTDEQMQPIGALIIMRRKPIETSESDLRLISQILPRTSVELQHHQAAEKTKKGLSNALMLSHSKSMFMANISHELRNPLSAIIGYASLIRDRQVDHQNSIEYANEICLAGEELLAMISDILSLSTLEISPEAVELTEFDITEVARTGRRLLREQAAAKNLTLLPVSRSEPLYVLGDSRHTKKALLNVINNAVKYTSMGEIEISAEANEEGEAVISVRDTGVGMTEAQLKQARKKLDSYESAYDIHENGVGLGIPLTHLLIENQGGRVEFDSEQGKGTTVKLIFPKEVLTGATGDFI
ncbi:MAG: HAMP domain-containing histidine kinase [Kordiimonadaceae bacterium]|nr:HAMP domain-containing histidine kinase [Kordiimonadaceae bacterium]